MTTPDSALFTYPDDPKAWHAVAGAIYAQLGGWDARDEASRDRLLERIQQDYPDAELLYDPVEGGVPRVYIWVEGRVPA